jgi:hypothetical protein
MGFETPLALLALAAAGLPILLHLLRRQDLPRRVLPTVALLRRAEAASKKRVRIVDLLLLAVRVLLLAAIAIGIAGPLLRVTLAYGDGSVASVAIVIDDSLSMGGRGDPTLLAQAAERAAQAVRSLPEGSEVALVMGGTPARVVVPRTDVPARVLSALEALSPISARGTDLSAAIDLAERELAGARHTERRMLVLSDFTAQATSAELEPESGIDATFERIGPEAAQPNASVTGARATPDPTQPGRLSIAVELRAHGMDGRTVEVVVRRAERELARQPARIGQGGARATLSVEGGARDPGLVAAIGLDDAIEIDDERAFLARPATGARVLIVTGAASALGRTDEARFLARAIDLAPEEGGALTRRRVDAETLATMELDEADVVVLANVPAPSERTAAKLRAHVAGGGGLFIAPGDAFDARAYAARFGDLLPARPEAPRMGEIAGPAPSPGNDLVPESGSGLEAVRTHRRLALEGAEDAPLRFGDGAPALVLGDHGDGRVALLATSLDDSWSDFPYRPGYLPAVVSVLRRIAPRGSSAPTSGPPGVPVRVEVPPGTVRARVVTPDGEAIERSERELEEPIELENTHTPGLYRVELAREDGALAPEPRLAFVVAPPPEESDLTPGEVPSGVHGAARSSAAATVSRPLAPWFFLLAGLLALAEAALRLRAAHLARDPQRARA